MYEYYCPLSNDRKTVFTFGMLFLSIIVTEIKLLSTSLQPYWISVTFQWISELQENVGQVTIATISCAMSCTSESSTGTFFAVIKKNLLPISRLPHSIINNRKDSKIANMIEYLFSNTITIIHNEHNISTMSVHHLTANRHGNNVSELNPSICYHFTHIHEMVTWGVNYHHPLCVCQNNH